MVLPQQHLRNQKNHPQLNRSETMKYYPQYNAVDKLWPYNGQLEPKQKCERFFKPIQIDMPSLVEFGTGV